MTDMFRNELIALIPKMRSYATVLTKSRVNADDLVQDTLLRVWRFRSTYQEGHQLRAWVMKIMRNEFLSQRARRSVVVDFAQGFEDARSCEADQDWRMSYAELLDALEELPECNREALLLVVALGFSCEETADLLGCAVGTVKSRVSRAREQLLRVLEGEPGQSGARPPVLAMAQC
ncbi:sigma-70 family RNA polymerase sigma factor [Phenylobacterium sp.]|uniref:sigma-70 family RNA polymerase sigma factor n=1 Tax=Phenylobacterium sp. TaxID=1871053 RepID=UPI002BCEA4DF|nr:sigma-70 family RNA polymerase sigma factor [Phenylobacterium sp.]HVI30579.1 sigma-70 family RNA polymerase sigma factor [Phenylobacterium sp.]